MEKTTKKTAKYYRDILSGNDIRKAVSVLPEVIKKYGSKRSCYSKCNDIIYIKGYTEFEWNHQIEAFYYVKEKNRVTADIYWQGDSTDGNESEWADAMVYGTVIPAEHEWLGDRTYCRHGDLRISAEEFRNALKAVAKYLSPEEMKARKVAAEKAEMKKNLRERVNKLCLDKKYDEYKYSLGWGGSDRSQRYYNGKNAVEKVMESDMEKLAAMDDTTLSAVINKVFSNNEKYDNQIERPQPGYSYLKEKVYNLAY